jgi:hypothetical protein
VENKNKLEKDKNVKVFRDKRFPKLFENQPVEHNMFQVFCNNIYESFINACL